MVAFEVRAEIVEPERRRRPKPKTLPEPSADTRLEFHPGSLEPILLNGGGFVNPVGESFYQNALEEAAGGRTEENASQRVTAALIPEPDNPHDSNAVGVFIDGHKVAHLSRKDAEKYQPQLLELEVQGRYATCAALIKGGWDRGDDDWGHYGIVLDLAGPRELLLEGGREEIVVRQAKNRVGRKIASVGLRDWWNDAFDKSELERIQSCCAAVMYPELGETADDLHDCQEAADVLARLGGWLCAAGESDCAWRCFEKATLLMPRIIDRHFMYAEMISAFYPWRAKHEDALKCAIKACELQIDLAPPTLQEFLKEGGQVPTHQGFKQLSIIRTKQGDVEGALELVREARRQGWNGDWDARVARLEKKLGRA